MTAFFSTSFDSLKPELLAILGQFDRQGTLLYSGRNTVKCFAIGRYQINIKAFKKPNLINKIAYRYFRKSKARRSFEHAGRLKALGVGTPDPVAYLEERGLVFGRSYYVSLQQACDWTFRDLIGHPEMHGRDGIIRQFVAFTHQLHEKGVLFLDHSPGNTLIRRESAGRYAFYLVDVNRMRFDQQLDYKARMANFSRLTNERSLVREMARAYAALTGQNETMVFSDMWAAVEAFQNRFQRKHRWKRRLKFWKS